MAKKYFEDTDIKNVKARIQYSLITLPAVANWLLEMAATGEDVYICHREDCHEDGSSTHYYYTEIGQKSFLAMGGKECDADDYE